MAEIQSLKEIFKREGLEFIQKLFSNYTIISEKLNATRFAFEKDEDGNFTFYKKDGRITAIERTITQLFEEPISYIENLPKSTKNKIPKGFRYGFRYFNSSTPINIHYDKVPENRLVLTDIKDLKTNKVVDDMTILTSIASMIKVQKPPIIWYGKLDDSQKDRLLDYLKTPEEQLKAKFRTDSFTRYMISFLNPKMKSMALNDDVIKPIDSIVFKFIGDDEREVVYSKLVDPIIQQITKANEDERVPQDMYGIILSDILEFIKINGLKKYKISKGPFDYNFLELICMIYNDYIQKNGYKFEGVELDPSSFSLVPSLDLNTGFIPNIKTRENIMNSSIHKNIFKIMMAAFSKPKKRPTGTITQLMIDDLREISTKIKEICGMDIDEEKDLILTFEEYIFNKKQKSYSIKD
jgi:hypothetical protein